MMRIVSYVIVLFLTILNSFVCYSQDENSFLLSKKNDEKGGIKFIIGVTTFETRQSKILKPPFPYEELEHIYKNKSLQYEIGLSFRKKRMEIGPYITYNIANVRNIDILDFGMTNIGIQTKYIIDPHDFINFYGTIRSSLFFSEAFSNHTGYTYCVGAGAILFPMKRISANFEYNYSWNDKNHKILNQNFFHLKIIIDIINKKNKNLVNKP